MAVAAIAGIEGDAASSAQFTSRKRLFEGFAGRTRKGVVMSSACPGAPAKSEENGLGKSGSERGAESAIPISEAHSRPESHSRAVPKWENEKMRKWEIGRMRKWDRMDAGRQADWDVALRHRVCSRSRDI